MPKFTTIPNLLVDARQSLRDSPINDQIVELGTRTFDNRDYWENNNFNESTLKPYLTDNRETLETINVDGIQYRRVIGLYDTFQYSIDALPFVTDPNNQNEIIRLDSYYDKVDNSNEYNLATEGKISFYIYTRENGRESGPDGHIDNYTFRPIVNKFDGYANTEGDTGFYLFKLNWGDGTEIEYTDEPKLLESTVLLNHTYEKPGFYTISGVVYAMYSPEDEKDIGGWEKFETKILLNPSQNYELNLYNYDNFATIGGISSESVLVKSAVNLVGINPINFDDGRVSLDSIENINLLDRLELFNFLNKVSENTLDKFNDFLLPFTEEFQQQERQSEIFGCMDENATNFNENANNDNGSCVYDVNLIFNTPTNSDLFIYQTDVTQNNPNYPNNYLWTNSSTIPLPYNSDELKVTQFNEPYSLTEMKNLSEFLFIKVETQSTLFFPNISGFNFTPINVASTLENSNNQIYESNWYLFRIDSDIESNSEFNGNLTFNIEAIQGCMDINADNYNPDASVNDNSCQYSYNVKVQGVAPYGNTQVNTTFGNNPTIPYSTLINNEQKILSANVIQDGYEFSGWEIINGENFQEGTIGLSSVSDQQTILTISQTANPNNYGTIVVRANFIQTTDGDDTGGSTGGGNTAGGNTGGGNTGGESTGGGNTGGGGKGGPGDDDVELPGDNEVDQYGGDVS
jgi:hypothetical protein